MYPGRYRSTRRFLWALLFLFPVLNRAQGQAFQYARDYERILQQTQTPGDSLEYGKLLPLFRANDRNLTVYQMLALMIGYTGRPEYRPFEDVKTERLLLRLNDSARYKETLTACDTFLRSHPLNQAAIIEKAYAFYKLGRNDSAAFYKEQFGRLMAAMDWSGNGRSPDGAMFAMGPEDGLNFVDKYYHAEVSRSRSVTDSDGNYCSAVEMKFRKDGQDRHVVFYFILQHAANTTAKKSPPAHK